MTSCGSGGTFRHGPIVPVPAGCLSAASSSRSRSESNRSKTEPTIRPHCEVPLPFPPCTHMAAAVLAACSRYQCQLAREASGGEKCLASR